VGEVGLTEIRNFNDLRQVRQSKTVHMPPMVSMGHCRTFCVVIRATERCLGDVSTLP
jgi:hypothetical protein